MAIPPFPSQDLAKLVLGYLIEEQLMTAYDEFLNESPYLDAQKNEYDRIMMNSLRNILAEYRAIKIYVEHCKPIALRRRLFQCSNVLEVVQFLVRNIDTKKLQEEHIRDRVSFDSQEATTSRISCDTCHSLRLESCVCSHKRRNVTSSKSVIRSESVEGRTLAQATSLSDLPGNQDPDKHTRVPEHQPNQPSNISQQEIQTHTYPVQMFPANIEQNSIMPSQIQPKPNILTHRPNVYSNTRAMECSQNIAEFNTVLNQVCNKSNLMGSQRDNRLVGAENVNHNRLSVAETFQDFTMGVRGPSSNVNIPDSSTTENVNVPLSFPENETKMQNRRNVKTHQKKKCVFRVGNVKHDITEVCSDIIDVESIDPPINAPTNPKPDDPKITILSNIRVGNDDKVSPIPKNATSTPLVQMQTIYINGTPVYNKPKPVDNYQFTRDEIMAMPTIILVPSSAPSKPVPVPTCVQPQTVMAQSSNITTSTCHTVTTLPTLPPLTVDVSNSLTNATCDVPMVNKTQTNTEGVTVQDTVSKPGLVKTVEAFKNASVPKDNIVSGSSSSTPQMLPPQRKSSSTPRRTSHVRVLDFTTPRRKLSETINENPQLEAEFDNNVEVMISKSPNVSFPRGSIVAETEHSKINIEEEQLSNTVVKTSEGNKSVKKKPVIRKKRDWDADLRALVAASAETELCVPTPKSKPKQKHAKKSTDEKGTDKSKIDSADKTRKKSGVKSNVPNSIKPSKKNDKLEPTQKPPDKVPSPTVSPTGIINVQEEVNSRELEKIQNNSNKVPSPTVSPIGIINVQEEANSRKLEKIQNRSNEEERLDTPEVERLSLRNEIGVRLNISDILETPYKQALYEIQMETPRFLGPELPDDPMSDIKITDIPTPRFLTSNTPFTPKPTPSSYSSRPTDYSSGGSYYKPDDQDYLPILDDVACPVTSTHSKNNSKSKATEITTEPTVKDSQPKEKSTTRNRSRPIRQCTKNVSYYNSPMINKNTNETKTDDVSSDSDTLSANSALDNTLKDNIATPRSETIKQPIKSGNRKNLSLSKKRSPLKKIAQKPFMKIKPRRPTPTKDSGRKRNRTKSSESQASLKGKSKVRNTGKNKHSGSSALVIPASTKSRRKSSTPRKLHCTKTFNSESSGHESPETEVKETKQSEIQNSSVSCVQDSDTEQLPLRWSDDGSQDTKTQGNIGSIPEDENDEISKIKEYIDNTVPTVSSHKDNEGTLRNDLVQRGFDLETAKIIERDLLNTPVHMDEKPNVKSNLGETKNNKVLERSVESDCSTLTSNLIINEEEENDDSDDYEFSAHECNESSANYFIVQHDESNPKPPVKEDTKLRDKYTMEICIEEDVAIRLIATPFNDLFNLNPQDSDKLTEAYRETEMAVSSISNMDKLYTPMKNAIRAQCYEIFDSTLTSIDTPFKGFSPPRKQDASVSEIVLEDDEEILEIREKSDSRKRKRAPCSSAEESVNENKKVKPETQLILQSKDIKDIDIEILLTKLHGS